MADGFLLGPDLRTRLAHARSVLVLTGAGMSAESGIPTFRDAQTGLWANYRPEELATPEAFERDPARVWAWYEERRRAVRTAQPHAGHHALVELEAQVPRLTVVTQNVDGLHQRAGSTRVLELHGNILRSKCHVSGRPISEEWLKDAARKPPRSPYVPNGLARPDVVWFGEILPQAALESAMAAAADCDFCFSIGTTSLVQPAASLPLYALEHGAALVEINPDATPLSPHAHLHIRDAASRALVTLVSEFAAYRGDNDSGPDQNPRPSNTAGTPR